MAHRSASIIDRMASVLNQRHHHALAARKEQMLSIVTRHPNINQNPLRVEEIVSQKSGDILTPRWRLSRPPSRCTVRSHSPAHGSVDRTAIHSVRLSVGIQRVGMQQLIASLVSFVSQEPFATGVPTLGLSKA
jgi:hypothetical protein